MLSSTFGVVKKKIAKSEAKGIIYKFKSFHGRKLRQIKWKNDLDERPREDSNKVNSIFINYFHCGLEL